MKKLVFLSFILVAFTCFKSIIPDENYRVNLRWVKSYEQENPEKVSKGILWALAFSGAELPKKSVKKGIFYDNDMIFKLDFKQLGFDNKALEAWLKLIVFAKNTEEYKKFGSIDIGRFLVFTVYSSWHYYQITGVPNSFKEFINGSLNNAKIQEFPVTNSCVANGHRKLIYYVADNIVKSKFIAVEGDGKLTDSTFREAKYEVIDLMKNGQLRYAVYDLDGKLSDASPNIYGEAGKPSKCMWCHEGIISPLFAENQAVMGYKLPQDFSSEMLQTQQIIKIYRNKQLSAIDFNIHKDHELSEILYVSFMEPSAERLAQEWQISLENVNEKLMNLKTHRHREFDFLGELYDRNEVEKFAPFKSVPIPKSVREPNENEPNIFR